jgi:hypothetical protein
MYKSKLKRRKYYSLEHLERCTVVRQNRQEKRLSRDIFKNRKNKNVKRNRESEKNQEENNRLDKHSSTRYQKRNTV